MRWAWLVLLLASVASANISMHVSHRQVAVSELLLVIISAEDQHPDWTHLDLTPWLPVVEVTDTEVVERWIGDSQEPAGSDYYLWLTPLIDVPEGDKRSLTLPALAFQDTVLPARTLQVVDLTGVEVWMRASRMSPTIGVNERQRFSSEFFSQSRLNASVRNPLVNQQAYSYESEKRPKVVIGEQVYDQTSLEFRFTPSSSGGLTVTWPSVFGQYFNNASQRWRAFQFRLPPQRFQAIDRQVPDNTLVADSLKLSAQWQPPESLRVGEVGTFTVTTEALGVDASFLSPLPLAGEYNGFSVYQESIDRHTERLENGWRARLTTTYAIAFNQVGQWQVPSLARQFFQPQNQRMEQVMVPSAATLAIQPALPDFALAAPEAERQSWPLWPVFALVAALAVLWAARPVPSTSQLWQRVVAACQANHCSPQTLSNHSQWPELLAQLQQALVANQALTKAKRRRLAAMLARARD